MESESLRGIEEPGNRRPWVLPEALADLAREGGAGLVAELLDDFRTDVQARLGRLRAAVASGDALTAKLEVHSIKGSAAQMGAAALTGACLSLEEQAGAHQWRLVGVHLDSIQRQFERVCEAIRQHPLGGE